MNYSALALFFASIFTTACSPLEIPTEDSDVLTGVEDPRREPGEDTGDHPGAHQQQQQQFGCLQAGDWVTFLIPLQEDPRGPLLVEVAGVGHYYTNMGLLELPLSRLPTIRVGVEGTGGDIYFPPQLTSQTEVFRTSDGLELFPNDPIGRWVPFTDGCDPP